MAGRHWPALTMASWIARRLNAASAAVTACSATAVALASEVTLTGIPRAVACPTSMASTPTPCFWMWRRRGAASMTRAVIGATRTSIASTRSTSSMMAVSSGAAGVTTCANSRKCSTPAASIVSVTITVGRASPLIR